MAVIVKKPRLYLETERLRTFKNWPFSSENKCNSQEMAKAGFYSISTCDDDADTAKCFLCGKELDGWEADDDPWMEHKSHAPGCAFVQLQKEENKQSVPEFVCIIMQYMRNDIARMGAEVKTHIDKQIASRKGRRHKK